MRLDRSLSLVTAAGLVGALFIVGAFVQLLASRESLPTVSLPYSLSATLIVVGVVVLVLAIRLHRKVTSEEKQYVNPFSAVRIVAGARALQLLSLAVFGLSLGLLAQLLFRHVFPNVEVWLPTAVALVSAVISFALGAIAEHLCRVPPRDDDENTEPEEHIPPTRPKTVLGGQTRDASNTAAS